MDVSPTSGHGALMYLGLGFGAAAILIVIMKFWPQIIPSQATAGGL